MKKKFASKVLSYALTGALMTGSFAVSAPVVLAEEEKNIPQLTEEPLTINVWDIYSGEPTLTTIEDAIGRFMEDYPNITVNPTHYQNDNYKQQLLIAMSSGQGPDMYLTWGGGAMQEYADSGLCNDITELFNTYDHPDFFESAVAQTSYNDQILGISVNGISGCVVWYNKSIFEKVGVEVPTTIDELETVCEKLKEAGYVPFSLANGSKWTGSMYYMYLVARHSGNDEFNAAYYQEDGGSFTSPAFIYAGEKIQEWVEKGYFPDGFNSMSADDAQDVQLMYNETCAMMLHGSWVGASMDTDNPEWYEENIGCFRFPEDSEAAANGVDQHVEVGTAIDNAYSFNCWNEDHSVDQDKLNACYVLATQYFNDEEFNARKIETENKILNIAGYEDTIVDPNFKVVNDVFQSASNVQLWYDQYLPATVTDVHKDGMTKLFGLNITPEELGVEQDVAMQEYWASK